MNQNEIINILKNSSSREDGEKALGGLKIKELIEIAHAVDVGDEMLVKVKKDIVFYIVNRTIGNRLKSGVFAVKKGK